MGLFTNKMETAPFNVKTFDKGIIDSAFGSIKDLEKNATGLPNQEYLDQYNQNLTGIRDKANQSYSNLIDSSKQTGLQNASIYGGLSSSVSPRAERMADRERGLAGNVVNSNYEDALKSGQIQAGMLGEGFQRDVRTQAPSMYANLAQLDQQRVDPYNTANAGLLQANTALQAGNASAMGSLLGVVGTVGGSFLGGPLGAAAGQQIGQQLGQGMAYR